MSITDELRAWLARKFPVIDKEWHEEFTAIADRIDAEHERVCKEQYACGVEHGIGASIEASMIQEHGFIELPKDADGVPIRLGDEVYQVKGGWVYTVKSITFYPDNTTVSFGCKHGFGCDSAHNVRHYHEPTVEDVLSEMLEQAFPSDFMHRSEAIEAMVAEYAANLRLADDGKEQ